MSSIVGYSDLLLSESAGILGAVQRKFLERIQASAERMEKYLKEHYLAIPMDENEMILNPEMVDLADVIDATIAETQGQFQERGIVLRLDLLDKMPLLLADQDALQQILIHLLNNAATATPKNGEIFFHTSTYRSEEDEDYVLIQVADEGGGIKAEDLPRVFSRLYREGNYQISGIGDSGVALPIVKALVEGHRGRIWIDTEQGKGSTVTLIMPIFSGTNGHHRKQRKEDGNLEGTS
jgi:signal transduction histidine kinase